jgi:transposase
MTAVRYYGTPRVDDPERLGGVQALGLDETAFAATSATRSTSFVTGIVDLTRRRGGCARLVDVIADRSASAGLTRARPAGGPGSGWLPWTPTAATPTRTVRASLPHAVRVLDAFHVVRLGFAAVDEVRCRIQREQAGHRGRTHDPLYGIRRLLRRAPDHHSDHSWTKLLAGLDAGDTDDEQLARTWIAAQDLRLIYHAPDRARAEAGLYRWLTYCANANIPELTRLATTIDSWRAELLAYFDTGGISNGPTEAINLLIKKIKRVDHGFRNFDKARPECPQRLRPPDTHAGRRAERNRPHIRLIKLDTTFCQQFFDIAVGISASTRDCHRDHFWAGTRNPAKPELGTSTRAARRRIGLACSILPSRTQRCP